MREVDSLVTQPVLVEDKVGRAKTSVDEVRVKAALDMTECVLNLKEVEEVYRSHVNESLFRLFKLSASAQIEKSAKGLFVTDHMGKKHLDCIGGFGVFSFGHRHPDILEAVLEQIQEMPLSSRFLLNEPLARLAKVLAAITPGNLSHSFLCNSGTEAVEGALKLARAATGRAEIIAMKGAFHGKTLGALSVSWRDEHKAGIGKTLTDVQHVEYGNSKELFARISEETAAVILEPVQGEAGIIVPPEGFLREVREICDHYGALLIADEVQTGLGRTGKNFSCEWEEIVPDVLCLGKALGGGIVPAAAIVANARSFQPLLDNPLLHTSTFGGNPLACVAALAAIRVLLRDDLARKARQTGCELLEGLQDLAAEYPDLILEARGKGLLIGVELHRSPMVGAMISALRKRSLLVCHTLSETKVIRLEPPLILSSSDVHFILKAFSDALQEVREFLAKKA